MSRILGISCHYHDGAAALLQDGQLVAAAEEERFTGRKHDHRFPIHAIEFVLGQARITADELDFIVFYEKPFTKFERVLTTMLHAVPRSRSAFSEAVIAWMTEKLWVKGLIRSRLQFPHRKRILFSEHHLSHAASAYYCSPYQEAAVLTVDGVGEWTTGTLGFGQGNRLRLLSELHFPHSVGLLYSAFTAFLGFEVNEGEYKVMGMAAYGQPRYVEQIHKLVQIAGDGSIKLDLRYFSFHESARKTFSRRFELLFGPPRDQRRADMIDSHAADLAASIQSVTEHILLKMAQHLRHQTQARHLCLAGGVALNSLANYRILREAGFEGLYVQPAATDAGGALGAALWVYHDVLGHPRSFIMEHAYWGAHTDRQAIHRFLKESGAPAQEAGDEDALIHQVVEALQRGQVVGWYQGRTEWGPRALGNRSILADPRRAEMKDLVNQKVKFREPFRPFAPSVLAERAQDFFDLPEPSQHYPARFMLYVVPVSDSKRASIPAVTHADGTARLQVVHEQFNPLYYRLIRTFGEATGIPVLMNTSFNLRGEPMVNTPQGAYRTFQRSGLDVLVMGPFLCRKR